MNVDAWKTAGDVAFYAITVSAVVFSLLYLTLSAWWRTTTGRNIAAMMGTIAVIGVYGSYIMLTRNSSNVCQVDRPFAFYQIRFALFAFLAIVILWRIIIFVCVQLMTRKTIERSTNRDLRS